MSRTTTEISMRPSLGLWLVAALFLVTGVKGTCQNNLKQQIEDVVLAGLPAGNETLPFKS